jgi:predicted kinase
MAGVPLVGKTTLAHHLVEAVPTEALHVENDELRQLVVDAMDRAQPTFDGDENLATYEAARRLVERGLETGVHVVHDATNLRERARCRTLALADELEAPARIVFVDAPRAELDARADAEGPDARRALDALGDRDPNPSATSRPHRVLDGTQPPEANVDELLADEAFASLRRSAEA